MTVGDQTVYGCEVRILRVLVKRVHPAIANGKAAQVDPRIFFELQSTSNVGNVVASVALARNVNLATLVLRVFCHEVVQEVIEVLSNGTLGPAKRAKTVDEAEASSKRLVNVHHVSIVVPRVLVVFKLKGLLCVTFAVFVPVWTVLCVQAQHG